MLPIIVSVALILLIVVILVNLVLINRRLRLMVAILDIMSGIIFGDSVAAGEKPKIILDPEFQAMFSFSSLYGEAFERFSDKREPE